MFLKLIDEHGTTKLVNVSNAQSVEKFVDLDETNNLFKTGIRIVWHDQILKDSESEEDLSDDQSYYYSEQLYFGISFEALESLMVFNKLLVPPTTDPAAHNKDKKAPGKLTKVEDKANGKAKDPAAEVESKENVIPTDKEIIEKFEKVTISDLVDPEELETIADTPGVETKVKAKTKTPRKRITKKTKAAKKPTTKKK